MTRLRFTSILSYELFQCGTGPLVLGGNKLDILCKVSYTEDAAIPGIPRKKDRNSKIF